MHASSWKDVLTRRPPQKKKEKEQKEERIVNELRFSPWELHLRRRWTLSEQAQSRSKLHHEFESPNLVHRWFQLQTRNSCLCEVQCQCRCCLRPARGISSPLSCKMTTLQEGRSIYPTRSCLSPSSSPFHTFPTANYSTSVAFHFR